MAKHSIFYMPFAKIYPLYLKKAEPNSFLFKSVVCDVHVEEVDDPLVQKICYLDKLIDELAKGKSMEKILRQ